MWQASPEDRYFLRAHRIRLRNQQCNHKTVCDEGLCCLKRRGDDLPRCQSLAYRGKKCSLRTLEMVYFYYCPCGLNQGTCDNGVCV
uniref:Ixodegrin B n=1 Tax=Rhipicephalus appendiculatus TaxID=34631 RepID=A0A131YHF1_RHIAP